jgi:hypothetical protein
MLHYRQRIPVALTNMNFLPHSRAPTIIPPGTRRMSVRYLRPNSFLGLLMAMMSLNLALKHAFLPAESRLTDSGICTLYDGKRRPRCTQVS